MRSIDSQWLCSPSLWGDSFQCSFFYIPLALYHCYSPNLQHNGDCRSWSSYLIAPRPSPIRLAPQLPPASVSQAALRFMITCQTSLTSSSFFLFSLLGLVPASLIDASSYNRLNIIVSLLLTTSLLPSPVAHNGGFPPKRPCLQAPVSQGQIEPIALQVGDRQGGQGFDS